MRLILATQSLGIGGSESYLVTIAEHLERLGHEVTIYSPEGGRGAEAVRRRGLEVIADEEPPAEADAALVQDAGVSYELASRLKETPQLFVIHSENFDPQAPPQLPGVVAAVVAMNDRTAARARGFASGLEPVRLRQPIDTERFVPSTALPERPRRALLISNNHMGDRMAMVEAACAAAGVEFQQLGGPGGQVTDPRGVIAAADIVIGYGRSILEAMSCGRAAYVYDRHGGDGWVTAESYPRIEAAGFGGRSNEVIDAARLEADLGRYDPAMGPVNHDIVMANHRATAHVQELVSLLRDLSPPRDNEASLDEMARLTRLLWRSRAEVDGLVRENSALREQLVNREDERHRLIHRYESTLSWRLTRPLRGAARLLRRGD